jgi:hypothetical protein
VHLSREASCDLLMQAASSRNISILSSMAVPVHEIRISDPEQFDDAEEDQSTTRQVSFHLELTTLDRAPDFDPREGQAFIDDDTIAAELEWSEGDEDEDEISDDDFGYDEVNHADWEVAAGGGHPSYHFYD